MQKKGSFTGLNSTYFLKEADFMAYKIKPVANCKSWPIAKANCKVTNLVNSLCVACV